MERSDLKVLVLGQGGREHALCWKLKQSPLLKELYCIPGNPGIAELARVERLPLNDLDGLVEFAREREIDLTIVGPEFPLSLGIVDVFEEAGLRIFGPRMAAAELESSKCFAKEVMEAAGVKTAGHRKFDKHADAVEYVKRAKLPLVLKVDGLAAGKGVFVCFEQVEVEEALEHAFGDLKAEVVLVEDFLSGVEASYIAVTDGERVFPLASSHDYKRIGDGDAGPNTGGMGAVCPTPRLSEEQESRVLETVMQPVVREMFRRGRPFLGFLYAGLMLSENGDINVLEFNVRLGDPEAQVILSRMKSDLLEFLLDLMDQRPDLSQITWDPSAAICVVLASEGYPTSASEPCPLSGLAAAADIEGVRIFHAGTALDESGHLQTSGGRVLNVTAVGADRESARKTAYQAVELISFNGRQYRTDIGSGESNA